MTIGVDPEQISATKGFLDEYEGRCLYDVALKASQLGPCLEIGSYCGKSAIYIGTACKMNNSILFSIDHTVLYLLVPYKDIISACLV